MGYQVRECTKIAIRVLNEEVLSVQMCLRVVLQDREGRSCPDWGTRMRTIWTVIAGMEMPDDILWRHGWP